VQVVEKFAEAHSAVEHVFSGLQGLQGGLGERAFADESEQQNDAQKQQEGNRGNLEKIVRRSGQHQAPVAADENVPARARHRRAGNVAHRAACARIGDGNGGKSLRRFDCYCKKRTGAKRLFVRVAAAVKQRAAAVRKRDGQSFFQGNPLQNFSDFHRPQGIEQNADNVSLFIGHRDGNVDGRVFFGRDAQHRLSDVGFPFPAHAPVPVAKGEVFPHNVRQARQVDPERAGRVRNEQAVH